MWPIYENLTSTATLGQSESGSNNSKLVLQNLQINRTGVSSSDEILCHTKDAAFFCGGGLTPLQDMLMIKSMLGQTLKKNLSWIVNKLCICSSYVDFFII